jgi:hypothetical protein
VITVLLVLITDLNYQNVPPVQLHTSMTVSTLIAKTVEVNTLTVLLVMLIPVTLVTEEEKLHSVLVQLVLLKLMENVLIVLTDVPPVLEETSKIVSLVLEKELVHIFVHVLMDISMMVREMLYVQFVHTNVLDVKPIMKIVPSVTLTELQFQPVTVKMV